MVLEGNVDPDKAWAKMLRTWNQGMNDRFPDAARVAAADHAALGLGDTAGEVTRSFLALADRLDRKPAPVPDTPAAISGALLRGVTYQLLQRDETLVPLTRFWKAAASKTPTDADAAVLRQVLAEAPATPGVPADNQVTMALAMICGDTAWSRDVRSYAAATRAKYPLSAGMPANIQPCAFWSKKPIEPLVTSHGPRNVLILRNRRDNATPWAAARGDAQGAGRPRQLRRCRPRRPLHLRHRLEVRRQGHGRVPDQGNPAGRGPLRSSPAGTGHATLTPRPGPDPPSSRRARRGCG